MTTLEKIQEFKKNRVPEAEIVTKLKEDGISLLDISNAMNQSKIKEAVTGEMETSTEGMVPSIMGERPPETEKAPQGEEGAYTPSPSPVREDTYQDYSAQENQGMGQQGEIQEEYYENESPQEYGPQGGYGMSSETMIEVAEQVFFEKIKKIEEKVSVLREFKSLSEPLIESMDERLKRIEKNFDKMQIAILDRVGSFGKNIDSLRKEVEMVEDSFGKVMKKR